uniref:Uncharacterized protein n=1 Tax=Macrostomum lignano TaxID=282301 RepID=A0A1I8F706_9PLAT
MEAGGLRRRRRSMRLRLRMIRPPLPKEEADAARKALASQLESERAAFSRQAAELAASLASLAEEQRARRTAEA